VQFKLYPRQKGFFESIREFFGNNDEIEAMANFNMLMKSPVVATTVKAVKQAPRADVELRATNLPQ
jgi:protease-4